MKETIEKNRERLCYAETENSLYSKRVSFSELFFYLKFNKKSEFERSRLNVGRVV